MILFIRSIKRKLKRNKRFIYIGVLSMFLFLSILIVFSVFLGNQVDDEIEFKANKSKILSYNFDGDIYFNNTDGFDMYYQQTINAIESAEHNIQIAMYSISDENIVNILERKESGGVKVDIVVPKSKQDQHKHVFSGTNLNLIEIGKVDDQEDINELMHHKFIIIDSGYNNQQLLFGSLNLTYLQQKYDSGFLIVTKDDSFIKIFQDEFNLLIKGKYGRKKISTGKFKPYSFNGIYNNGFVDIWFGPGFKKNNIKTKIIEEIDKAESTISIIGWRFNDDDIYRALKRKANQGVIIDIILDDYYIWDEVSVAGKVGFFNKNIRILSDSFMDILLKKSGEKILNETGDSFNSFVHHHALIIDNNLLFTGTNNWSYGGFYYNDETVIVTDIKKIVAEYVDQFDYLYNKLHGKDLILSIDKNNKLKIDLEYDNWNKIIIYNESINSELLGNVCLEINKHEYINDISVPERCNTNKSRVFVLDLDGDLIASSYLNF